MVVCIANGLISIKVASSSFLELDIRQAFKTPYHKKKDAVFLHGGTRDGAGRPAGSGRWGESCVRMNIPQSRAGDVRDFLSALHDKRLSEFLPLFVHTKKFIAISTYIRL